RQFINQHSIMVVPLHSGSGMRAKILEAMALAKVVLTTSLGLEGIEAEPGREVLIADTPEAFVRQLDFCRKHPEQLRQIGQAARDMILRQYDNHRIAQKLATAYQQLLQAAKE
ncbi:MAG: glycosyltransferase, partial [Phaeodactylibacter sp.]|nr:glycosyltransferase [Phaeodactylibacter sp.]